MKPYLEQLLTWVNGPNPPVFPVVGGPTTYSVTVRLVNPTPYAITFSTPNNVVTGNIPAGNVTFQGNVQQTQGTVTSQPSVGGTGNIVWNPGTVAGGSTVILAYRVAVTPTAPGQRIPVTGLVSSGTGANGTRAQFVDETGNTTQSRATLQLGPVCELAANVGLLTPAVVTSVRAHEAPGGVEVEWDTASEVGTVGFDLLRWDPSTGAWVTLNQRLLPGLQGSPQGGSYRFLDEGASPHGRNWYVVAETNSSGRASLPRTLRRAPRAGDAGRLRGLAPRRRLASSGRRAGRRPGC